MPPTPHFQDVARYWRSPLLPGGDMLTAQYYEHEFAPHWHDAFTIPVIEAGAERFDYLGASHVAAAGSVPAINPGCLHTGARAVEVGWQYRVFYVPVEFMRQLAEDIDARRAGVPWLPDEIIRDTDLAVRIGRAHRLLEAGIDGLAAETALLDAFSTLLVRHARTKPAFAACPADAVRVEIMKARLAASPDVPLTLGELAATVGLSTCHAARLFSNSVGLPPHAWRNQLRLQRALAPLRAGASVTAVAAASGFTDQSHFTRHFKRAFGVPPGHWRGA